MTLEVADCDVTVIELGELGATAHQPRRWIQSAVPPGSTETKLICVQVSDAVSEMLGSVGSVLVCQALANVTNNALAVGVNEDVVTDAEPVPVAFCVGVPSAMLYQAHENAARIASSLASNVVLAVPVSGIWNV